jgi:hypothetical protein
VIGPGHAGCATKEAPRGASFCLLGQSLVGSRAQPEERRSVSAFKYRSPSDSPYRASSGAIREADGLLPPHMTPPCEPVWRRCAARGDRGASP